MNRPGAYRVTGPPHAERLKPEATTLTLRGAAQTGIPLMISVGNAGCIQIHGGRTDKIVPMGPRINVMDSCFNLNLRADRPAELYLVWKPTRNGDLFSVEVLSVEGELILQLFGYRKDTPNAPWNAQVAGLPRLEEVPA